MVNRHVISSECKIIEALDPLNSLSGGVMTLFVVDGDGRVVGSLTDGDIRRGILDGIGVDENVTRVMFRHFEYLKEGCIDVARLREIRGKGKILVPVLNSDGTLSRILNLKDTRTLLPLSAILMAGGKGERLRPLTETTPKPLLQIDGKAIIDYNIEALSRVGVADVTVTTRYLAEKIHEHFAAPVAGIQVKCVTETMPLGTIGSASLVELPESGDTLVMNSDLLTTISFEDMYLKHVSTEAAITIAAVPYTVSVPYAILATDSDRVVSLQEKPTYSYYANAGIYIIANRLLRGLPHDSRTDATDLIEQTIASGEKVVYYPVDGTWIDVGSPVDFTHAAEMMRHHNNLTR